LKDPLKLDRWIRDRSLQIDLMPRFLMIALLGFAFYGICMSLVISSCHVWPHLTEMATIVSHDDSVMIRFQSHEGDSNLSPWLNGRVVSLIIAYVFGLIAATGICLPSLYFYGLLSGVKMTLLDIVLQAVKSKAVAAVALVGVLPIYAAVGLGLVIFSVPDSLRDSLLILGLILHFLASTAGTYSLYRGFSSWADTMSDERRQHRECFLRRLTLSWAACYSAVSPVLIYTLWQRLQG